MSAADIDTQERSDRTFSVAVAVAALFIAAQFTMIVFGLGSDLRFYTWAPHDQQGGYDISVVIAGRALTEAELLERYRRSRGVDPRAIAHVFNIVEQYETTYGADDGAQVQIRYWVNGEGPQVWHWPR